MKLEGATYQEHSPFLGWSFASTIVCSVRDVDGEQHVDSDYRSTTNHISSDPTCTCNIGRCYEAGGQGLYVERIEGYRPGV